MTTAGPARKPRALDTDPGWFKTPATTYQGRGI
jgi:hypothetical protein